MGPTPKYSEFSHTAPILPPLLRGSQVVPGEAVMWLSGSSEKTGPQQVGPVQNSAGLEGCEIPRQTQPSETCHCSVSSFPWAEHSEVYKVEREGQALACLLSLLPFDRDALWSDALGPWCHGVYIMMGMDHMSPATLSQKKNSFALKIVRAPLS